MPSYKAPVDEVLFLLDDVFRVQARTDLPRFSETPPDIVRAILTEAARYSETVLQPLNRTGDRQGCVRQADGSVRTPDGFKEAFRLYAQNGWAGLSIEEAFGGQDLPLVFNTAVNEFCTSANMAFTMYPGLTKSALSALLAHGNQEQKQVYAPKLASGEWLGTMNLTEPQCGTDLGLLRTRAAPQPDGSYRITGQKIFISAGDHDLTSNIVHLVLARIEGAPAGTKGISLFIVPKRLVEADGSLGEPNAVSCGSLEQKMGIHGNATCVMNYDGATGWLMGEANRGLNAMFVMMNEARLGVANQGLALSEVAYQNAAAYAKQRLQGRAISGRKGAEGPADPIMVHPDVRRMLLSIRAFNEAARALLIDASLRADLARGSADPDAARGAEDWLGLMTPVLKGLLTDWGFRNCVEAQQVFGGHGYVAEWGMEQFVRDARIAMIYEGTNGIQGLDLVGRKLGKDGGRAFMAYTAELAGALDDIRDTEGLGFCLKPMKEACSQLQQATMWFMQNAMARPDHAGAGSTDYMHLFGLVALGHMWLLMGKAALARKAADPATAAAMDTKLVLARFFMERMLPECATRLARITAGADTLMALDPEAF